MGVALRDGGAFRTATQAAYRDVGVWRALREIHYRDAGAWRKVFGSLALALSGQSVQAYAIRPSLAIARLQLSEFGSLQVDEGSSTTPFAWVSTAGQWSASGAISAAEAAAFECRADVLGGTTPSGPLAQWLGLSVARTWQLSNTVGNTYQYLFCQLQIQLREIANPSNVVSAVFYLSAEKDTPS